MTDDIIKGYKNLNDSFPKVKYPKTSLSSREKYT